MLRQVQVGAGTMVLIAAVACSGERSSVPTPVESSVAELAPSVAAPAHSLEATRADAAPAAAPVTIFDVGFSTGTDGFNYRDDAFRGSASAVFASGVRVSTGGQPGGALQVNLGGINSTTVVGMSGGWAKSFTLTGAARVSIRLQYQLTQQPGYESDDLSQALISIDGKLKGVNGTDRLAQVAGNGNGGGTISTGWVTVHLELGQLAAGSHEVVIGAYNNKKNALDEATDILFDNVKALAWSGQAPGSCDGLECCSPFLTPVVLTQNADQGLYTQVDRCIVSLAGSDSIQSSGARCMLLGGADADVIMAGPGAFVRAGAGNDVINSYGGGTILGNAGDDELSAGDGDMYVVPGPGKDKVTCGTGNDIVAINHVCETFPGEILDGGSGTDVLITPVPLADLQALGVIVRNFEEIRVESHACQAECGEGTNCIDGTCIDGATPADIQCECKTGTSGRPCVIIDPQSCAERVAQDPSIPPSRRDEEIILRCLDPGSDVCSARFLATVNVHRQQAARQLVARTITPADYLAIIRDRGRKVALAKADKTWACRVLAGDADDDLVPNDVDACATTPPLTPTTDVGCTDPTRPPDPPDPDDVGDMLDHIGIISHKACQGASAPGLPEIVDFHEPFVHEPQNTTVTFKTVANQPTGCPVTYQFMLHVLARDGVPVGANSDLYVFALKETDITFTPLTAPFKQGVYVLRDDRPGDAGRYNRESVHGSLVRVTIQAMNGNGQISNKSTFLATPY